MATTASILAVFVPVATMKGIIGRIFVQFGLTVAFAVSVSLFVAFTLTPMLSSRFLRTHTGKGRIGQAIERFLHAIDAVYRKVLGAALRHRGLTVGLAAVLLFVCVPVLFWVVPKEFMATEDRSMFSVKIELPSGSSLAANETFTEAIASKLRALPGVRETLVTIGGTSQSEINRSEIQVNLVKRHQRKFTQAQAVEYVRKQFPSWTDRKDVNYAVEPFNFMGGGSAAFRSAMLQFNVRGRNYDDISKATDELTAWMKSQPGYVDIDVSYRGGKPEVAINIDRDRAADLGVPIAAIASTVRSMMAGDKVSEISSDGQRWDVRLRLDEAFRQKAEDLLAFKIRSTTGQLAWISTDRKWPNLKAFEMRVGRRSTMGRRVFPRRSSRRARSAGERADGTSLRLVRG